MIKGPARCGGSALSRAASRRIVRLGSRLYSVTLKDELICLDLASGSVLVGNERGEVFDFEAAAGTPIWSEQFEGVIRGIGTSEDVTDIGTLKGSVLAWTPPFR